MSKYSRFKKRQKVSSGHLEMRKLIANEFPIQKVYEEYPYELILKKGYRHQDIDKQSQHLMDRGRKLKADFFLPGLGIIIEFDGEHHYKPIYYTDDKDKHDSDFESRKNLDKLKRLIAKESGYQLINWPYWQPITPDNLYSYLNKT